MARIGSVAARERALREAAAADAIALYAEYGANAIELLTERTLRPESNADDRRRDRLARLEVERLDRIARNGPPANALVLWKPPLFSVARLRQFFKVKPRASYRR